MQVGQREGHIGWRDGVAVRRPVGTVLLRRESQLSVMLASCALFSTCHLAVCDER
jgi:hypothetical protein